MPNAPTPNLGLTVPTVGGDFNIWGNELNTDLFILDGLGASAPSTPSTSGPVVIGNVLETFVMATGGPVGITLTVPVPASFRGKLITIKKVDANFGLVTITPTAGTIDGNASYLLVNQYQYIRLYSDGTNWQIVGNN